MWMLSSHGCLGMHRQQPSQPPGPRQRRSPLCSGKVSQWCSITASTAVPSHPRSAVIMRSAGARCASLLGWMAGHWRFGIIGSPTDSLVGAERLAGVLEVLQARRARSIEVVEGDYTHDSGGPALDRLFALMKPRPSAVIAANDAMAIGAIDRAVELGIRVPRGPFGWSDSTARRRPTGPLIS